MKEKTFYTASKNTERLNDMARQYMNEIRAGKYSIYREKIKPVNENKDIIFHTSLGNEVAIKRK